MKLFRNIICLILAVCSVACSQKQTELILSPYISNGMLLQQNAQTKFWGKASPGTNVKVQTDWDCLFSATANNDSIWQVSILTPKADNKQHNIEIYTTSESITISNVLIGELWMVSGDAFMEFPLIGWPPDSVEGAGVTLANEISDPLLRFFHAKPQYSITPMTDVEGAWLDDSKTLRGMIGAVAYYFGQTLRDSLKVPVGVVVSTCGESRSESWIRKELLPSHVAGIYNPEWRSQMDDIIEEVETFKSWLGEHKHRKLEYGPNGEDPYLDPNFEYRDESLVMSDYDFSTWEKTKLPAMWEQTPIGRATGICWFVKTDTIPKSWVGKALKIYLGAIDDRDVAYFNGYEIGRHMEPNQFNIDRVYEVPRGQLKSQYFTLLVKTINTGGPGGFRGCSAGRMRIVMEGNESQPMFIDNQWAYRMTGIRGGDEMYFFDLEKDELKGVKSLSWTYDEMLPTVASNAMWAPFEGVAVKGVLWSNGEHNEAYADSTYRKINEANIETFKSYFGKDISFYQLQVMPSVLAYKLGGESTSMMGVRRAQFEATKNREKRGTISMMDMPWYSYHSPYKRVVGERFARMALSRTYGVKYLNDSGPEPISVSTSDPLMIIRFKNNNNMTLNADACQFEVAGDDGEYFVATTFVQGPDVAVFSHAVPHPKKVRYAAKNMVRGTFKNEDGLPSLSFEIELQEK